MDVIKAIESFQYYHSMTGQSREEWAVWRVQACSEWMLDESILGRECVEDGSSKGEPDHSSNDEILHESEGDRGRCGGIGQHSLSNEKRLPGEDGPFWARVQGPGDSPGGCD